MSWLVSAKQYIPAVLGEPFGGGYFAGYISHTADGNPTHALIVAPRATGATGTGYTLTTALQLKTSNTTTAGTTSTFDGAVNTAAMVAAGINDHPAAKFCVDLSIGGFTDWYLPSQYELDIAYFNFKPTTNPNSSLFGVNNYSVPQRLTNRSLGYPAQTTLALFNTTQQGFNGGFHWTSTEASSSNSWVVNFNGGEFSAESKSTATRVRAFRRIAL